MPGVAVASKARARSFLTRRRVAVAVLVLFALAAVTREGRTVFRAVALLPYVFPNPPAKPLSWVTPAPVHEEVRFSDGARVLVADLYRPGWFGPHSAMVLSLGVNPVRRDDPALVQLAEGLARDGFVVLVPDSPDLRANRILPSERDAFVAAVRYLDGLPYVDRSKIGFVGFSVGASLLTVAASDPRVSGQVRMVNFFGGYYDAFDLLRAIAARRITYRGTARPWEPAELAERIFANVLLEDVDDAGDRAIVRRALVEGEDLTLEEATSLGARARLVYELFTVRDVRRVDELVGSLPSELAERLRAVSPSTYVGDLRARMYLMHDTDDSFIPYVESRRFADRLPERQRVHTEFSIFAHVQPTKSVDLPVFVVEVAKLLRHLYLALLELT